MDDHDVTFENSQARSAPRCSWTWPTSAADWWWVPETSELALGWATYNGDHMSMYSVNASIPKTLVRRLVSYVAGDKAEEDEALSHVLSDILTPLFPRTPARHRGADRPEDRGSGPLRAARLLPLLCHPLGLPAPEGPPAG